MLATRMRMSTGPNPWTDGNYGEANESAQTVGDAVANRKSFGVSFEFANSGTVLTVSMEALSVSSNLTDTVCGIYADNSGSPGTQVGGDSGAVTVSGAGKITFEWSSDFPEVTAGTRYWVVFTDGTSGTGNATVSTSDAVTGYVSGYHDTVTSITEQVVGDTTADFRVEVTGEG